MSCSICRGSNRANCSCVSNKLIQSTVQNYASRETSDLRDLYESMGSFIDSLKDIVLGEYSDKFFEDYYNKLLGEYGSSLEEFLKIPKMGKELDDALKSWEANNQKAYDDYITKSEQFLTTFRDTLDNMEYEARSPYDLAVKHGFIGTELDWLSNILNSTEMVHNILEDARTFNDFIHFPKDKLVQRRLKGPIPSLENYLDQFSNYEQLVLDAVDNTVLPDGVVTDTLVVKTASKGGQIPRTQRDKNQDSINARDYGAIGDGVLHTVQEWVNSGRYTSLSDVQVDYPLCSSLKNSIDSVAIQKALSNHSNVHIPEGTYIINKSISLSSGNRVLAEPGTVFKADVSSVATTVEERHIFDIGTTELNKTVSDVAIYNLTLEGLHNELTTSAKQSHLVNLVGSLDLENNSTVSKVYFYNTHFKNSRGSHVYLHRVKDVRFLGCSFTDSNANSVEGRSVEDLLLQDCFLSYAKNYYLSLIAASEADILCGITLKNTKILATEECTAHGILIESQSKSGDLLIEGCTIKTNNSPINCNNIKRGIVTDSSFEFSHHHNRNGAINFLYVDEIIIERNKFIPVDLEGIHPERGLIRIAQVTKKTAFNRNSFEPDTPIDSLVVYTSFVGTRSYECNYNHIKNVTSFCEADFAIGNYIENSSSYAFRIFGVAPCILYNTFVNCNIGIDVAFARGSLLEGNTFIGCDRGIQMRSDVGTRAVNNTIESCREGIFISATFNSVIGSNTISKCSGYSLNSVNTRNLLVSHNYFLDAKKGTLYVRGLYTKILHNSIENEGEIEEDYAIELNYSGSRYITIKDNICTGFTAVASLKDLRDYDIPAPYNTHVEYSLDEGGSLVSTPIVYTFKDIVNLTNDLLPLAE